VKNNCPVSVIIPALNEEQAIGQVISAIPKWVDEVIVVDNGSTDKTTEVAKTHSATVISEKSRGYGAACIAGINALSDPRVVVFMDGDFSDFPEEMSQLVDPIIDGKADVVIGARVSRLRESGSLTLPQRLGNLFACALIRFFWKFTYSDLGPFRAIAFSALKDLRMADRGYGWPVEMQIKAVRSGLRVTEVPVSYRRRIGKSKISGTFKGTIAAGTKILFTIFIAFLRTMRHPNRRDLPGS
jgi:glycosyltransferase involved in cell wall biosynthesis